MPLAVYHQAHVNILQLYRKHWILLLHQRQAVSSPTDAVRPDDRSRRRCDERTRQILDGYQRLVEI